MYAGGKIGVVVMVSSKKYKADVKFERDMHNHYLSLCVQKQNENELLRVELKLAKAECEPLKVELREYKQKYLDEQHKRLLLAEQVERLEDKLKNAERCGYTND
jgi:chromosome segregation ATPase